MRRAQVALQSRERVQERAHLHIGVDAQFELAAVRGAARDGHFDPQISLVREADLERGRLGDDRAIRRGGGQIRSRRAQASVLLIGNGGDEQIPGKRRARFGQRLGGGHAGGEAALHVVGAAAVELAVANRAGERLGHAGDVDRVAMRVEHQGTAAACAGEPADHAGAARLGLESFDREPDRMRATPR